MTSRPRPARRRRRLDGTSITAGFVIGCLLGLVSGCGAEGADTAGSSTASNTAAPASSTDDDRTAAAGTDADACSLLSDDEVTAVIGGHGDAEQDYLFGGCHWPSTDTPDAAGAAWGLRVATAIDDDLFASFEREPGEPIIELGDDATYHEITSELWFSCGGQHCVVSAIFDPPSASRQAAIDIAHTLQDRLDH